MDAHLKSCAGAVYTTGEVSSDTRLRTDGRAPERPRVGRLNDGEVVMRHGVDDVMDAQLKSCAGAV